MAFLGCFFLSSSWFQSAWLCRTTGWNFFLDALIFLPAFAIGMRYDSVKIFQILRVVFYLGLTLEFCDRTVSRLIFGDVMFQTYNSGQAELLVERWALLYRSLEQCSARL